LLQIELEQLIGLHHRLVQVGMRIDWASLELAKGATLPDHAGRSGHIELADGGTLLSEVSARSK